MSIGIDWGDVDEDKTANLATAKSQAGVTFGFRKLFQSPYRGEANFGRDWAAMLAAGVTRCCYVFPDVSAHAAPARDQIAAAAKHLAANGGLTPGDMAPAFDTEFPGGKLPRPIPAIVTFLEELAQAMFDTWGCWPLDYTSARVWDGSDTDALGAPSSWIPARCPLWVKTGYPDKAGTPFEVAKTHQPSTPPKIPAAWNKPTSPGAWVRQWDGDIKGLPGFSSTVDLNRFLSLNRTNATVADAGRVAWVQRKLVVLGEPFRGPIAASGTWDDDTDQALGAFQTRCGLTPDRDIGPATFAFLSRLP